MATPSNDPIRVLDSFRPTNPPLTNGTDSRSAKNYLSVLRQFEVESNPRYTPGHQGHGETYCNIFLWDATKAMGAEVPHWVDPNGNPTGVGRGRELNANAVCDWLKGQDGKDHGWSELKADEAVLHASLGMPTVVVWKNPGGIGHVGMVIPSSSSGVRIAQAGLKNFFDGDVTHGFGNRPVTYYGHE